MQISSPVCPAKAGTDQLSKKSLIMVRFYLFLNISIVLNPGGFAGLVLGTYILVFIVSLMVSSLVRISFILFLPYVY